MGRKRHTAGVSILPLNILYCRAARWSRQDARNLAVLVRFGVYTDGSVHGPEAQAAREGESRKLGACLGSVTSSMHAQETMPYLARPPAARR